MKVFRLIDTRNNSKVAETLSSNLKDVREYWKETIEFYSDVVKLKIVEVGKCIYNREQQRHVSAYYSDLGENSSMVKGLSESMLSKLVNLDFANTNTNFFMIEKGLLKDCREALTETGEAIRKAFS